VKNEIWNFEYQGHQIRVINKISWISLKRSIVVQINGITIQDIKNNVLQLYSTIITSYIFNNKEQELEIRISSKSLISIKTGCQIFIDDRQIGGDSSILYPDPSIARKYIEDGFLKYCIVSAMPSYGLPTSIGLAISNLSSHPSLIIKRFIFSIIFSTLIYSLYFWNSMKSMLRYRIEAKKKMVAF
jgi:hypothetical protein